MSLNARRLLVWVSAMAAIGVTASAGVWQLGRADQKRAAETALARQREAPPWTNADWPCERAPQAAARLPVHRPVLLRGHWLARHTVFLDNRPMGSASGFIVVTPLRLSGRDGDCPGPVVLVQRGWVPRHAGDRLRLPVVETPAQEVAISGRVASGLSQVYQLGVEPAAAPVVQGSAPVVRQNADSAFWSAWLRQAPLAGAVLQTEPARPSDAAALRRAWPEPGQGQSKHLAYAAQWFAMAAILAGLTLWFQVILPARRRSSSSTPSLVPADPMSQHPAAPADPLVQMSVHSLPRPGDDSQTQRTRWGRVKMLLVWAVCAAPVVASYFAYYVVRPEGRTNYGVLISPPRPMPAGPAASWTDAQGKAVTPASLKGQWLLIAVAGGACDARCEQHLYEQRQLREMLGRDKDRLDRVWLVNDAAPVRDALLPAMKDAWVLRVDPDTLRGWLAPEPGQPVESHLYLVDPRGDWMMRFPADANPSRVKKDLVKLLKASESWDEAGR